MTLIDTPPVDEVTFPSACTRTYGEHDHHLLAAGIAYLMEKQAKIRLLAALRLVNQALAMHLW